MKKEKEIKDKIISIKSRIEEISCEAEGWLEINYPDEADKCFDSISRRKQEILVLNWVLDIK